MAKLLDVVKEITAEAHRLHWILVESSYDYYNFDEGEINKLLDDLVSDLESVNLPALVEKLQRRGNLIQKEQDRRHQNKMRKTHKAVLLGESDKSKLYQIRKLLQNDKEKERLTDTQLCFLIRSLLGVTNNKVSKK